MPAPDYIEQFLKHLAVEKRYSHHTVNSYQKDLSDLQSYITGNFPEVPLESLKLSMLRAWLASLKQSKLESRTVNRKISSIRSFYKYLLRQQVITASPASAISFLKIKKTLPSFVEAGQVKQLTERDYYVEGFAGDTEYLVMMLFYTTGMRVSELTGLKETDIDPINISVSVWGKGNKQRIIPLKRELVKLAGEYIVAKRKHFEHPSRILLVNKSGNPLTPAVVYRIVKRLLGPLTTLKKKSPHVLRHTFATHLSDNGAAINAIKELLGHSSLAATQVYTHTAISKLKEVHKQAHPKA